MLPKCRFNSHSPKLRSFAPHHTRSAVRSQFRTHVHRGQLSHGRRMLQLSCPMGANLTTVIIEDGPCCTHLTLTRACLEACEILPWSHAITRCILTSLDFYLFHSMLMPSFHSVALQARSSCTDQFRGHTTILEQSLHSVWIPEVVSVKIAFH